MRLALKRLLIISFFAPGYVVSFANLLAKFRLGVSGSFVSAVFCVCHLTPKF